MGNKNPRRSITEAGAERVKRASKAANRNYVPFKISSEPERWAAVVIHRNEAGDVVNLEAVREAARPDRVYTAARRALLIREMDLLSAEAAAQYWKQRAEAAERRATRTPASTSNTHDVTEAWEALEEEGTQYASANAQRAASA